MAADLTAERAFAAAFASRARYRGPALPQAWLLMGSLRIEFRHALRRGSASVRAREKLGMERLTVDDLSLERIEELVDVEPMRRSVKAAMGRLRPRVAEPCGFGSERSGPTPRSPGSCAAPSKRLVSGSVEVSASLRTNLKVRGHDDGAYPVRGEAPERSDRSDGARARDNGTENPPPASPGHHAHCCHRCPLGGGRSRVPPRGPSVPPRGPTRQLGVASVSASAPGSNMWQLKRGTPLAPPISAPPLRISTIALSPSLPGISVAFDSVWVLGYQVLTRLDPVTGDVGTIIDIGSDDQAKAVAAGNSLWVSDGVKRLTRIDPRRTGLSVQPRWLTSSWVSPRSTMPSGSVSPTDRS